MGWQIGGDLQNMDYFVALLLDRLDRLEKVILGDDLEAIREMIFLERSAFHAFQRFLEDQTNSFPREKIEPIFAKVSHVTQLAEGKKTDLECKLKQIQRSNEKLRKFTATERTEIFVSKSV